MKGLHGWMRTIEGSQAAVLSSLLKELDRITASDESSGMQLADIILKDASLTSTVMRIANAVSFNPGGVPVTTVSRAILNIGFKNIRSLCLSIKVLEAVLKDSPSPMLVAMLAKSLHGANQAKALCPKLPPSQQEEVFVASLLSHLAELLVLGANVEEVRSFSNEVEESSTRDEKNRYAEKFLGVSFSRLSKTLMKQWRINGLVNEVLLGGETTNPAVEAVELGDEISRAALLGWDSIEFKEVMERVAEFKEVSASDAKAGILETSDETAIMIKEYGKQLLVSHIPTSKKSYKPKSIKVEVAKKLLKPDADIQLKILQQLSEIMITDFNINVVFKNILQGIHKGVGLERSTLAIFDKSHNKVVSKYVAGEGTEKWLEQFVIPFERSHSGFLYNMFDKDQVIWLGHRDFTEFAQFGITEFQGITKQKDFFIAPLIADKKRIGFIYADMGQSSRDLSVEYFDGFKRFMQQVKLALTVLASKQKK